MNQQRSDEELMAELAGGDVGALSDLYVRYARLVRSALRRFAPEIEDEEVDELVQDIFLAVNDAAPKYEDRTRFRAWLYTIAVKKAKGHRRTRFLRGRLLAKHHGMPVGLGCPSDDRPSRTAAARQEAAIALSKLPTGQWEAVLLHAEGFTGEEIADILSIRVKTVWTRLHRARATLSRKTAGAGAKGGRRSKAMRSICQKKDVYLDGRLSREDRAAFEEHLQVCDPCREATDTWRDTLTTIADFESEKEQPQPTWQEAQDLRRRAEESVKTGIGWMLGPRLGFAVAAALVLAICGFFAIDAYLEADAPPEAPAVTVPILAKYWISDADAPKPTISTDDLPFVTVPEDSRMLLELGSDEIGVLPGTRARILRADDTVTHLSVERGAVACRVEEREPGKSFRVTAGSHHVKVVGTSFSVERGDDDAVRVTVEEGAVEIARGAEARHLLRAGQRYGMEDGRISVLPAKPDELRAIEAAFEPPTEKKPHFVRRNAIWQRPPAAPPKRVKRRCE